MNGISQDAGSGAIKVLIVDDSATVRQALIKVLSAARDIEVIGTASDPYAAAERMRHVLPDVILLDIEMPRMDGLTFLRKIMAQRPVAVVICSTLTEEGSQAFAEALEAGAVDVITKPRLATAEGLAEAQMHIVDVVRAAAHARVGTRRKPPPPLQVEKKLSADAIIAPLLRRAGPILADPLICIGASTGGTEAIREVLTALPANLPGIVIVQHMPEHFTAAFARRLNSLCAISIKEAADGDAVLPGQALIAPGNRHTLLVRTGRTYRVTVKDGPHVSRHRPSVDVLFRSAAQAAGANALGVILTGMGDDGAQGLLEMRQTGSPTIAQDEESCVVFGMPKEAIQRGAAGKVLPLRAIAAEIIATSRTSNRGVTA